jgi:hypothetical protein
VHLFTVGWVLWLIAFLVLGWRFDHAYREAHGLPRYWNSALWLPASAMWRRDAEPHVERARRLFLAIQIVGPLYIFVFGPVLALLGF